MTSETKFTPGPWALGPAAVVLGADGRRVCQLNVRIDTTEIADAHLIASSPELYEALERCRARLLVVGQIGTKDEVALNLAHAALAKARGEQS